MRSTRLLSRTVGLHPDPELSGSTLLIVTKSITKVLIVCSTPPHSNSFAQIGKAQEMARRCQETKFKECD
jgi:hypothetical protein